MKQRMFVVAALAALVLTACGGGGDSGPATTQSPTPVASTPSPATPPASPPPAASAPAATGSGEVQPREAMSRVLQATTAATTPATGTATGLPVVPAGEIQIDGIAQYVTLYKTAEGKYYGLSDSGGTYLVDPSNVKQVCFNSSQVGWNVPGFTSRSCSPLNADGFAVLPKTCNKDIGQWNLDTVDGKLLWFDHTSQRKFTLKGIAATLQSNGLVAYGDYKPATVSLKAGPAGTAELTYNWQNNCMGGFGLNGKLTDLNPNLPLDDPEYRHIVFLMNSDKEGWGLRSSGERLASTKSAYAIFDTAAGSYSVTFVGLKCNDRGNLTVYKGTGPSTNVAWDYGSDDFGAGWGIIQNPADPFQFWSIATGLPAGANLSFDRVKFQLVWSITGCTT